MNTRQLTCLLLLGMIVSACAPAPAPTPTPEPAPTTAPAVVPPTVAPPPPTPTMIPLPTVPLAPLASLCAPQVSANSIINVRNGPGTIYSIIGSMNQGQTAQVDGKNADGSWWRIVYASATDGHGWVAGMVTTSSCITATLPVIPASSLPVPFVAAITNVSVTVDPGEVSVPGCVGEAPRMTATAIINASGPMQVTYYFEIDGVGTTKTHSLTFNEYGSREVSESFKPEVDEGRHGIRFVIEGLDLSSWRPG